MVPGSTLMYGSNFCSRTRRPRCSSNMPIDAQVRPLPSELTTPPVTKMCLATLCFPSTRYPVESFHRVSYQRDDSRLAASDVAIGERLGVSPTCPKRINHGSHG